MLQYVQYEIMGGWSIGPCPAELDRATMACYARHTRESKKGIKLGETTGAIPCLFPCNSFHTKDVGKGGGLY